MRYPDTDGTASLKIDDISSHFCVLLQSLDKNLERTS